MDWLTKDEARVIWRDAPADDDLLGMYLEAARVACESYAPVPPAGTREPFGYGEDAYGDPVQIPENYRLAQAMQARNIWNAAKASPSGGMDESFGLTTMPLDWQVKQLLRPQRGLGAIA